MVFHITTEASPGAKHRHLCGSTPSGHLGLLKGVTLALSYPQEWEVNGEG